ncbi:MAG: phosphotransferase enzyme family protein [bacterium]
MTAPRESSPSGVVDATLPALDEALDPSRVASLLQTAWSRRFGAPLAITHGEVTYVRYKPDTSLIAGYRFSTENASQPAVLGYGKLVPELRAREAFAKANAIAEKQSESQVLALDPLPFFFHLFPFDREIRGLRHLMNRDKLKRIARDSISWGSPAVRVSGKRTSLSLLRYKPERRAVVAADFGLVDETTGRESRQLAHLKAYANGAGESATRVAGWLAGAPRSEHAPRFARTLAYDSSTEILFQERLPGCAFLEAGDIESAARRVGSALAWLHTAGTAREKGDAARERSTVAIGLAEVRATTAFLTRLGGGGVSERAAALLERLDREVPAAAPLTMTHGDFHYHQILVDGETISFVDFDEAGNGDPRVDIGNFIAHLRLLGVRNPETAEAWARVEVAFVEGYRRAAGASPLELDSTLPWFIALGLARLAVVPFRNLSTEWPRETGAILKAGVQCLAR